MYYLSFFMRVTVVHFTLLMRMVLCAIVNDFLTTFTFIQDVSDEFNYAHRNLVNYVYKLWLVSYKKRISKKKNCFYVYFA